MSKFHEWLIAINYKKAKPLVWLVALLAVASFVFFGATEAVHAYNTFAWVTSNLLVAYIALLLCVFVAGYQLLFDPSATTAGRFVFRFALSLIGVIGLVAISLFVDPQMGRRWFEYPGDVLAWRPTVRLLAYGYVAYTITGLAVLLGYRKWRPELLRTAPADQDLVKPRNFS